MYVSYCLALSPATHVPLHRVVMKPRIIQTQISRDSLVNDPETKRGNETICGYRGYIVKENSVLESSVPMSC
jgi:hypothetical protein